MHVDQEPVGARNTCWLVSCGMTMRYDEGWAVNRIARAAPGAWPGVAGGCLRRRRAQTRSWSPRKARELRGRNGSTCPAPMVEWVRGCRVEPPSCAYHRARLRLAPADAMTPLPATVASGGPFMARSAPRSRACQAAACTGSCVRCLAIGRPKTRRAHRQPGPSGDCAAYLRTCRSAPIPRGRADA
jgi:hypothetical protein